MSNNKKQREVKIYWWQKENDQSTDDRFSGKRSRKEWDKNIIWNNSGWGFSGTEKNHEFPDGKTITRNV